MEVAPPGPVRENSLLRKSREESNSSEKLPFFNETNKLGRGFSPLRRRQVICIRH